MFESLHQGTTVTLKHKFTAEEVDQFAALSGDYNPLHLNNTFAQQHGFKGRVVYGMLTGAYISNVLGNLLPGPGALWLSQSMKFVAPVYIDDEINIEVSVQQKSEALHTLVLDIHVYNQRQEVVLTGEARVMVMHHQKPFSWDNITAIITGSSRGIGAALAETLGRHKANIVVNYLNNQAAAEDVVATIMNSGGKALSVQADITTLTGCQTLTDAAKDHFGGATVLVNNATPFIDRKPFLETSWSEFDRYYQTYIFSAFNLAQQVIPFMKDQGFGRIIHILSSAVTGTPPRNMSAYIAAKSALLGLSKSMAIELAGLGITVNCISPSVVTTDQWQETPEKRMRAMAMSNPSGRLSTPDDIAKAALSLIGEGGQYITGTNLLITGGEVML
jgi:3-oxoacyl-[acyl-carrier protein] reductase